MLSLIRGIREEVTMRLDDVGERTFKMRKDLDHGLDTISGTSHAITAKVEERTKQLEKQSSSVSTLLSQAEVRGAHRALRARAQLESP